MLQKLVNFISDEKCVICKLDNQMICNLCENKIFVSRTPTCFLCNKLSEFGKTCPNCRRKSKLSGVIIGYRLEDEMKKLIYQLKYFSRRDLAKVLASKLSKKIKPTDFDLITFAPSDGKTLRRRGYNQAKLLAKELSIQTQLPMRETLLRVKHTPQVGANRVRRLKMVENNFIPYRKAKDQRILIVDDVLTTGATLNECARIIKAEGAKSIWGLVVAKK